MAERGVQVDDGRWPVLEVVFFDHASAEDWQWGIDEVLRQTLRGAPFAVVANGTALTKMPNARLRQIGASLNVRLQELKEGKHLVAWANVAPSAFVRGAITAIQWIAPPPPYKQRIFATPEEAHAWCRVELGRSGIL